jgi:hypothetical protein
MKHGAAVLEGPQLPKMELIPPRAAKVEGVFRQPGSVHDQKIIYTEVMADIEATKAAATTKLDHEGKEVWKKHPTTGVAMYPIRVAELQFRPRRYVLLGNNRFRQVKRVYNFEPTQAELDLLAQQDAERDFFEGFVKEAVKAGMTPAQLVARLTADLKGDDAEIEIDVTEEMVAAKMDELGVGADMEVMTRPDDDDTVSVEPEPRQRGRKRK